MHILNQAKSLFLSAAAAKLRGAPLQEQDSGSRPEAAGRRRQHIKKDFRYLGHSIVLYATDVFHWAVLIDDKPLLRNDEKAQFRSLREARNAGFAAIRTLEHPEAHEQDHV
jgi:hypothetical protein